MIKPILSYGNELLRNKSVSVTDYASVEVKELITDMFDTMNAANGLGLAACQIGSSYSILVKKQLSLPAMGFINPIIVEYKGVKINSNEGCLSIPGVHYNVPRYTKIAVEYYDVVESKLKRKQFKSTDAIVLQHEIDHLNGKLFIDYIKDVSAGTSVHLESFKSGKYIHRLSTYDLMLPDGKVAQKPDYNKSRKNKSLMHTIAMTTAIFAGELNH